ncbi:phosphoribosyltransferase [Streptomyces vinaceus]|nr:phosphoribosyltransferase [Streptomyces vinaceus]
MVRTLEATTTQDTLLHCRWSRHLDPAACHPLALGHGHRIVDMAHWLHFPQQATYRSGSTSAACYVAESVKARVLESMVRNYSISSGSACRVYSDLALRFDGKSATGHRYLKYLRSDLFDQVDIGREYVSGEGMARLFRELKRRGVGDLPGRAREVLCNLLAPALHTLRKSGPFAEETAIVPVPGRNGLSATLAKIVTDELADRNARYVSALSKTFAYEMKQLPWSARRLNCWRICRLERDIHARSVILIDDVAASGTTISAAARAVRRVGVINVTAVLLSADTRGFAKESH